MHHGNWSAGKIIGKTFNHYDCAKAEKEAVGRRICIVCRTPLNTSGPLFGDFSGLGTKPVHAACKLTERYADLRAKLESERTTESEVVFQNDG